MANIMITQKCNLKCSYCFANEFVNKKNAHISIENFMKAVDFIMTDQNERIGLIGGEPTIHPEFKKILDLLIENNRVRDVMLFTNGIKLDEFLVPLMHPKFRILVNCNPATNIGEKQYNKMVENLDKCINEYYMRDKITLGINLYSSDMDYGYILDLLKRYNMKRLRISITVPNCDADRTTDALEHFEKTKDFVLKFFKDLDAIGVVPFYDCNPMPSCLLTDKERNEIIQIIEKHHVHDSNLVGDFCKCNPVVDILPDLRAVRCFGLSEYKKLNVCDYENIFEMKNEFFRIFDSYEFNTCSNSKCIDCKARKTMKCSGGCLAFKIADILKMQKYSDKLAKTKDE